MQPHSDDLLNPFLQAAEGMLRDWGGTEIVLRETSTASFPRAFGDLAATMALRSADGGRLVVSFPAETATRLAARIVGQPVEQLESNLVHDCVAELANLIAGHAKVLLANTPYGFDLATPVTVPATELTVEDEREWRIAAFESDLGPFVLQVSLARQPSRSQ